MDLSFLDGLSYYENLKQQVGYFDIAGLGYHYPVKGSEVFVGTILPEPTNAYDSDARIIIRSDGQKVGYIPRAQHRKYQEFNPENVVCPFVGEIKVSGRGGVQARVKAIIPKSKDFVMKGIEG